MHSIARATEGELAEASRILGAYFDAIGLPAALRDGPGDIAVYVRGPGALWLARRAGQTVGVIGLRPLAAIARACEIKRLYVDPAYRGHGIADALLDTLEAAALAQGYSDAYLDTRDDLRTAIAFYRRRGYETCDRYNDNPEATTFMRRALATRIPDGLCPDKA